MASNISLSTGLSEYILCVRRFSITCRKSMIYFYLQILRYAQDDNETPWMTCITVQQPAPDVCREPSELWLHRSSDKLPTAEA